VAVPPAEANLIRGLGRLISGVLAIPISTVAGTFSGPPILGTALGAVNGVVRAVGMAAGGALDIAASGVSLAKMAGPVLLPFLF
jgi:hypothetical protein